MIRKP